MVDIDASRSHVIVDGQFVSAKVQRLVEAIRAYSSELDVQWVPPGARTEGQAAYAIRHNPPGGMSYTIFHVKNDEDFDERVLAKIIANDQRTGRHELSDYEAYEEAQRRVEHQMFLDEMEEAADIAAFALKTHLHTYTIPTRNGGVKKIRE